MRLEPIVAQHCTGCNFTTLYFSEKIHDPCQYQDPGMLAQCLTNNGRVCQAWLPFQGKYQQVKFKRNDTRECFHGCNGQLFVDVLDFTNIDIPVPEIALFHYLLIWSLSESGLASRLGHHCRAATYDRTSSSTQPHFMALTP